MTRHGITYIGYEKDEFGYLVKFNINGIIYKYEMELYWLEKVEQVARHSEPKALQMAKRYGQIVDKIKPEKRKKNGTATFNSSADATGRPGMAEAIVGNPIQRARELVRRKRMEGQSGKRSDV